MTVITASPTSFQQLLQLQRASVEHLDSIRSLLQAGDPIAQRKILEKLEQLSSVDAKTQAQQLEVSNTTNVINEKNVENISNVSASNKSLESKIESLKIVSRESLKTQIEALKVAHEQSKVSVESQVMSRESVATLQPMGERAIKTSDQIREEIKLMRADNSKALKLQIEAITTQHNTHSDEQANAVAKVAEPTEQYKSVGEKFSDFKNSVKGSVSNVVKGMRESPGAMIRGGAQSLAAGMVSSGTIKKGGLTDTLFGISKREARNAFVKKQQALDSEKTVPELQKDFVIAGKTAANIKGVDSKIEDFKKLNSVDDATMAKTKQGRALLDEKAKLTTEYAKVDKAGQFAAESIGDGRKEAEHKNTSPVRVPGDKKLSETPALIATVDQADAPKAAAAESIKAGRVAVNSEEDKNEHLRAVEQQTDLLTKIEENTRGGTSDKAKSAPQEKTTMFSGIAAALKSLGGGIRGLGAGIGKGIQAALTGIAKGIGAFGSANVLKGAASMLVLSGALFTTAKALQEFASVEVESMIKAGAALLGLAGVAFLLGKATTEMIKGALAIGVLGAALYVAGKGFQTFAELDWETIGKGMVALVGLGVIGAAAGAAAPLIALGAGALGLMGAALWVVGEAMQAVGKGFSDMTSGLEKLAKLDGSNLLGVAAGIGAIGLAMAAFGAGQAAAGLGNLVSRFLTLGTDSPVDQLIKIGQNGPGVIQAGEGLDKVGQAMAKFSGLSKSSMDAVNDFPWIRATAFVAAGGRMSTAGTTVESASKQAQIGAPQTATIASPNVPGTMAKPTTATGVIVEDLTTKVGVLKEQKPATSNNTVIAPSNTTVNNTTNTSKMFPPARNEDSSMDRYRLSRVNY
jgi:hypothetical protein